MDNLERHSRRNNLRFYGINGRFDEKWENSETKVRDFLRNELDIVSHTDTGIERAHRLREKNKEECPIIVKFCNFKERSKVLEEAKRRLGKGSGFSVREDFSDNFTLRRRELGKRLAEARKNGQFA